MGSHGRSATLKQSRLKQRASQDRQQVQRPGRDVVRATVKADRGLLAPPARSVEHALVGVTETYLRSLRMASSR